MRAWGLFLLFLWTAPAHALVARVSEARLSSAQRVVRMGGSRAPSIWVQFYTKDFRRAVKVLKESLEPLPYVRVEIESFYRATGEARLIVPPEATEEVLRTLRESGKIKVAGQAKKMHISEMKGPAD